MSNIDSTVTKLEAVRESARDPRGAYLIRSRIRRALLACARDIAGQQNLEKPRLPGQWALRRDAPSELAEIVAICRRVYQNAEHLCQPSESFDVRWESSWLLLSDDLDLLQSRLRDLGKSPVAA
jgi:hypothetical protein